MESLHGISSLAYIITPTPVWVASKRKGEQYASMKNWWVGKELSSLDSLIIEISIFLIIITFKS